MTVGGGVGGGAAGEKQLQEGEDTKQIIFNVNIFLSLSYDEVGGGGGVSWGRGAGFVNHCSRTCCLRNLKVRD